MIGHCLNHQVFHNLYTIIKYLKIFQLKVNIADYYNLYFGDSGPLDEDGLMFDYKALFDQVCMFKNCLLTFTEISVQTQERCCVCFRQTSFGSKLMQADLRLVVLFNDTFVCEFDSNSTVHRYNTNGFIVFVIHLQWCAKVYEISWTQEQF